MDQLKAKMFEKFEERLNHYGYSDVFQDHVKGKSHFFKHFFLI